MAWSCWFYLQKSFCWTCCIEKNKAIIDDNSLKLLYMSLVQSQMDYCCEIWGNRLNTHTERITKLQKRAARLILKCNMFTSSKEMFLQLNWLPFYRRVQYFRCIFVFKCINNLSSEFFKDIFKPVSAMHDRHTRSSSNNNLAIPKCHTEYYKNALCYSERVFGQILFLSEAP